MDRFFLLEFSSDGIALETAQVDFYASWLGLALLTLSVVGYRIIKRIKKG